MRFVSIKSEEQQALLVLHRVRETLVGQRIQLINTIRGHMAEFGVVAAQGAANVQQLIVRIADPDDTCIPARARAVLLLQVDQLRDTERRIAELDDQVKEQARQDEAVKRLMTIPGVGRWSRLRSRRPSAMAVPSFPDATWRRGSASCLDNARPAARSGWSGSPKQAMVICGACW
jgi:transposase